MDLHMDLQRCQTPRSDMQKTDGIVQTCDDLPIARSNGSSLLKIPS